MNSICMVARSELNPARFPKYITGTDRRPVHGQTVFPLTHPCNTYYLVKDHFFAQILTRGGAQTPLIY
jgi:hypothetical protein